jgi:hypothetical protein
LPGEFASPVGGIIVHDQELPLLAELETAL